MISKASHWVRCRHWIVGVYAMVTCTRPLSQCRNGCRNAIWFVLMQGISSTDGNNISQEKAEQGECDAANPAGCENRFERMLRYKFCNLDMDISNKSDRIEWGHLRYQTVFYPDASLEFIFQWIVCTGPLVYELVNFHFAVFHFIRTFETTDVVRFHERW